MAQAKDMVVDVKMNKEDINKLDQLLKEMAALRADIKALKMNMLQINSLKVRMGERV